MIERVWTLSTIFLRIGLVGYGGGNQLIPMVEHYVVPRYVTAPEFAELVGMQFAFPGISALKLAGVVGYRVAGYPGVVASTLSLVLPGLVLMLAAYSYISANRDSPVISKILTTMKYASPALLAATNWSLLKNAVAGRLSPAGIALMVAVFIAILYFRVSPLWSVLAAVAIGLLLF